MKIFTALSAAGSTVAFSAMVLALILQALSLIHGEEKNPELIAIFTLGSALFSLQRAYLSFVNKRFENVFF